MKSSVTVTGAGNRTLNGSTNGAGGGGGVTYVFQPQQQRSNIVPGLVTSQPGNLPQQNGGGSQTTIRRFANSNVVQVRRIITQQPQLHKATVEENSSSESSGFEPAGVGGVRKVVGSGQSNSIRNFQRRAGIEEELDLDENDSVGDVDVSIVGAGDEDDEDLLIDHDELDDGEEVEGGGDEKSAFEMNGAGVDSQYLRHVIETQILNRHKTRIKDWDGTKGHMCQSCHETFLSESGLETHRNRRIHHILFYCRCCKRDLSFFNKCRLIQHLRNHRVTPTVSGLQNCTMIRLLPESEYLHFEYEDCTSSSEEDDGVETGGGGSPPKRLKPNRFRRVKGSGSANTNDKDSDNSAGEGSHSRQIVAPPLPATSISTPASTTIISTASNPAASTIKYANGGGVGEEQSRSDQVTVIKSTGNITTTSIVLSSPTIRASSASPEKETCPNPLGTADEAQPQIRIRNLSQITVSVNDGETQDDYEDEQDEMEIQPVVVTSSSGGPNSRPQIVKVPAPTSNEMEAAPSHKSSGKKGYCCFKCDKKFESGSDFFKHLVEAEQSGMNSKSLHRCPTDDIPSWSQCQYVFHTKVFHEKSVPFMCPGCGKEHSDYNSLLEHVTNACFYLSQRSRYMCAASAQKCSFTEKTSVKTEPEIIDHLKKEHSRSVLQCLHCTQGFATDNWLLKHLAEAHNIQLDESKGTADRESLINKTTRPLTQCLICNILFPNGPTYLQHVYLNFHMHILYAKILECQSCFAVFETNEELNTHRKQNEKCRKLDPFRMKISGTECSSSGASTQLGVTPTPIKIIANPAAIITTLPNKTVQISQQQQVQKQQTVVVSTPPRSQSSGSAVITVVSSSANGPTANTVTPSQQKHHQPHQKPQQQQHLQKQVTTTSFQQNKQKSSQITTKPTKAVMKKSLFDDLLSCQFCERLVLYSSLRKHEDQCSGLSTVAPGFCLTCRQNFGNKKVLARHGIVHIREGLPICLFCNNRHIRPTHPTSNTPSEQETSYALKKHLYSNHTSRAVKFPYQCTLCDKYCRDKRATEFHIKEHQFRVPTTTIASSRDPDPAPVPTSPDDLQKLIKLRRKCVDSRRKAGSRTIEVYYCPVCKNREFALEIGLARHLTLVHQKDPNSLNLSLLKKASTARRYAVKGPTSGLVQQQRGIVSDNNRIVSRTITSNASGSITQNNNSNRSSASLPSGTRLTSSIVLRKRIVTASGSIVRKPVIPQRQLPNTRQRSSTESSSKDSQQPTSSASGLVVTRTIASSGSSGKVRRRDGTFQCLKCPKFICKNENEFCEHVKWKHVWSEAELQKLQYGNKAGLEEPSEYWCPECNTLFVAKPSLVRHLKFAHEYISNVEEYMQKIGYDGKKPLKPNQCEVCFYQCADDRELQQHIRTHGMAFLRLRQQRQSSTGAISPKK